MKINGEEVELVTSFDQLRAGMIVWINPCRWCGLSHRGLTTRMAISTNHMPSPGSKPVTAPVFHYLPQSCKEPTPGKWVIGHTTVMQRRLYRVVDPKLTDASDAAERQGNAVTREAVWP